MGKDLHDRKGGLQWLFLVGIPLGTFIILPTTGAGWILPKLLLFAAVGCLTGILLIIHRERLPLPFGGALWWFLLAYIMVVALSPLWSVVPTQSILGASPRFLGVITYLILFTLGYLAFLLSAYPRGKQLVLTAVLLSHAGVVLYGFLQIASLDPFAHVWEPGVFLGRPFSTLGQPNALGSFLLLTTPFVSLSALQSHGANRWWKCALVFAGLLLLLLATASRAAFLGLGTMAILTLALRWQAFGERTTTRQRILIGVAMIGLLAVGGYALNERFTHPTEAGRSESVRLLVWSSIPAMLWERPEGYGLESFGIVFPRFFRPEIYAYEQLTAGVDRAHSLPLDLLVTLGPAGFLSFSGFLLLLLLSAWRHRGENGVLVCLLAIVGYSVSLLFGFETVVTGIFFWVTVGFLAALLQEYAGGMRMLSDRSSLFGAAAITAITAVMLIVSVQWMRARITMRDAEELFREGKRLEAMEGYLRAREYFPFDREILVQGAETALFAMEEVGDAALISMFARVAGSMVEASMRLSRDQDGMAFLLRAWLSALAAERERTEGDLTEARLLLPMSMATHRIAVHSYEILGMEEEKERAKQELRNLLPSWWRDRSSAGGRLLWKTNPWLEEFL